MENVRRSTEAAQDDSLEAQLGGGEKTDGVDTTALQEEEGPAPILMTEADMVMAHRLDGWNLRMIRILIVVGIGLLGLDYLRRANHYALATLPLPLPSAIYSAVTPMPAVVVRPQPARRSVPQELAWLLRRGDSFLYLAEDPSVASKTLAELEPFTKRRRPVNLLRVTDAIDDDFVFESLWFGRGSFVVDSPARAERILARFLELLEERKATRARVKQVAHVVWDLEKPLPDETREALTTLAEVTGLSLFLTGSGKTSS